MKTIPFAAGVGCDVPLDSISSEDLFQFYANAKATFHHALGHNGISQFLYADSSLVGHHAQPKQLPAHHAQHIPLQATQKHSPIARLAIYS